MSQDSLPIIDFFGTDREELRKQVLNACINYGFMYVKHNVDKELIETMLSESSAFFALPHEEKMKIAMIHGGKAWRGFFPVGAEYTSGRVDNKEGIYFGTEDEQSTRPMEGKNLFPESHPALKPAVLAYIKTVADLAESLLKVIAEGLELDAQYFTSELLQNNPTVLFRIFNYPSFASKSEEEDGMLWSVGAHCDYGLLTMLHQDNSGGLEVRTLDNTWLPVPPIEGTFVVNLGDMLERMTNGLFRSTLHRVRHCSAQGKARMSAPLFFDPAFGARLKPLPIPAHIVEAYKEVIERNKGVKRWDGRDVHAMEGDVTYGHYLLSKVEKVFPDLFVQTNQPGTIPTEEAPKGIY